MLWQWVGRGSGLQFTGGTQGVHASLGRLVDAFMRANDDDEANSLVIDHCVDSAERSTALDGEIQ
jgi:hypothetical protein